MTDTDVGDWKYSRTCTKSWLGIVEHFNKNENCNETEMYAFDFSVAARAKGGIIAPFAGVSSSPLQPQSR
jgi:hypothetical protein